MLVALWTSLVRKKPLQDGEESDGQLSRSLNLFDLTFLGIGSTLGLGVYVLAGTIARNISGPAVILSFMLAAIAAVFSGLCYAEFGARVPKAGSAYVYSYVTVGEMMAFIIGWNMILEYVIGTSSVARGYSQYMDSLPFINGTIKQTFSHYLPLPIPGTPEYFDILAFSITLLLTVLLAFGVKESTRFNNVFTCINLTVVLFVFVVGGLHINFDYWSLPPSNSTHGRHEGGFFPFGVTGMLNGAGSAFYAFVGFDAIATTGEEVVNPRRNIPLGILFSLIVVFIGYVGVSAVATLVVPFNELNNEAPLPYLFYQIGMNWAGVIVGVGALFALSTSLMGAMFPLPRVMYAMGSDGLIFKWLARVHPRFQTPFIATIISGIFAGTMAGIFNVDELTEMMSIGTLLAYALVAVSVIVLRYECTGEPLTAVALNRESSFNIAAADKRCSSDTLNVDQRESSLATAASSATLFGSIINLNSNKQPTMMSSKLANFSVGMISIFVAIISFVAVRYEDQLFSGNVVCVSITAILFAIMLLFVLILIRQPTVDSSQLSFSVPFCPWIPLVNLFINIYLMMRLRSTTWMRFIYWMIIGFLMYFGYGIRHSTLRRRKSHPEIDHGEEAER